MRPHPVEISISVRNICSAAHLQCKLNWPETHHNARPDAELNASVIFHLVNEVPIGNNWFVFCCQSPPQTDSWHTGPGTCNFWGWEDSNGLNNDRNFYKITHFTRMADITWGRGRCLSGQCLLISWSRLSSSPSNYLPIIIVGNQTTSQPIRDTS